MSDANTIDSLKISVESTAEGAGSSLDKLAENLSHLASSLKDMDLGKVASGFETLAQGITNVATATQGIDASALKEVADAYDKIAGKANNAPTFNTPKIKQTTPEAVPKIANIVDVEPEIESVNRLDNALSSLKDRFKSAFSNEGRESAKNEEIQALIAKVKEYKQTISDMNSGKTPFNLSDYNAAKEGFSQATAKLASLKGETESASGSLSEFIALLKKTGVTALAMKGISAPFKLFGKLIHHGIDGLKEFGEKAKTAGTKFSDFGKKVGQRFMFTLLRKAINAVIESLKAGIDALAQFDGAISNTFDRNLGNHIAGLKAFGYQLVAAFAPIYNAIAPAVTYLIGLLNTLAQAMAQVFSGLTGHSTWVKSVAASADYSKSLEKNTGGAAKNAKDMKKQLAGFDRLNNLTSNDKSGGGGGGGKNTALDSKFEESNIDPEMQKLIKKIKESWKKADFTELGTIFGKKVKKALQSVPWDFIQEIAEKVGKSFATFLNGFIETEGLGEEFGKAIGEAINTYVQLIDGFFANLHFENLGKFVGDTLNGLTDAIDWDAIGEGWATKLDGLFDMLKGIAEEWDASETGEAMALAIVTAIEEINWGENGKSLATFLNDLFDCLDGFLTNVPWEDIGVGIADDINGFFGTFDWNKAGKTLSDYVSGMFDFVSGLVNNTDWKQIGKSVTESITSFFGNLKWESVGSTISGFFSGLFDFLTGLLDGIDWEHLPRDIVDRMAKFFKGVDIGKMAKAIFGFLEKVFQSAFELLGGTIEFLNDAIVKLCEKIGKFFEDNIKPVAEDLWNGFTAGVKEFFSDPLGFIKNNIVDPFINGFKKLFKIGSPSKVMEEQGGFLMDGLAEGVKAGIDAVVGFFTDLKDKVVGAVEGLGKKVSDTWGKIKDKTSKTVSKIKETAIKNFDKLKTKVTDIMNKVKTNVKERWNSVKSKLQENEFVQKVSTTFNSVKSYVTTNLSNAWSNTKSKWNKIKNKINENGFVKTVEDGFKDIGTVVQTKMSSAWSNVKTNWGNIKSSLKQKGFVKTVTSSFTSIGKTIADTMDKAWKKVGDIWGKITSTVSKTINANVNVKTTTTNTGNNKNSTKAEGGAFYGGNWHDIPQFATGGKPNYGTAFIAGEAGAEVVGHINGRTEVLNESQLASVMYDSINSAMAQQNALLREEIAYLKTIASKDTTISSRDVFNAVRSESSDFKRRTGRPAFGV